MANRWLYRRYFNSPETHSVLFSLRHAYMKTQKSWLPFKKNNRKISIRLDQSPGSGLLYAANMVPYLPESPLEELDGKSQNYFVNFNKLEDSRLREYRDLRRALGLGSSDLKAFCKFFYTNNISKEDELSWITIEHLEEENSTLVSHHGEFQISANTFEEGISSKLDENLLRKSLVFLYDEPNESIVMVKHPLQDNFAINYASTVFEDDILKDSCLLLELTSQDVLDYCTPTDQSELKLCGILTSENGLFKSVAQLEHSGQLIDLKNHAVFQEELFLRLKLFMEKYQSY